MTRRIVKVKLVDNTMGASYIDSEINFSPEDLAWWQHETNRRALSDKVYPDVTAFCFKGSDLIFRARTEDFFKATK